MASLFLLMPFAAADGHEPGQDPDGSEPEGPEGDADKNDTRESGLREACHDAEDRERCVKRYCEAHPRDADCRELKERYCRENRECRERMEAARDDRDEKDKQADRRPEAVAAACERALSARVDAGVVDVRLRVCAELKDLARIHADAKHVSFEVDRDGKRLVNYTVGGRLLLDAVEYDDDEDDFRVDRKGNQVVFRTDDARLIVHDNPTGTLLFKSDNESIYLVIPEGAVVEMTDAGARIQYDGYRAMLVADDILAYENGLLVTGHAMFHAPRGVDRSAIEDAIEKRKVGGEIKLDGGDDVTTYEDVNITIERRPAKITANDTLRVVFDAHLDSGRTFVLDLDPELLSGPELVLRYFDVHDDGNETEVVFNMADSLEDILDPNDDGGQPEYYIVTDADGTVRAMVSVPQWSVHAIEIASIGEFLVQPSVVIGIAAGVAGVGIAALGMFRPRRQGL